MAASQEEDEDEIARGVLWALVSVAGTQECAVQWAAPRTQHHSGREGPQSCFLKASVWSSHMKLRFFSAYFSVIKGPVLCSDCVSKNKNINHSEKFSAGTEVFFFMFYKITMRKLKAGLIKSMHFQIYCPRDFTPTILKEINEDIFSLLALILQCIKQLHYIHLQC